MKFRVCTLSVFITAGLIWLALTPSIYAQPKDFSRDDLIKAAREIMTTTRYCALITNDGRGRTNARTMDAFAPDEKMVVWFGTNPASRKVAEVRRNSRVTLYYFDRESQAYVTLHGVARVVNDPQEKLRHWKDDWKNFYPDREKGYVLIEVRPIRLEVVNTKTGIVSKSPTWDPPSVTFAVPKRKRP
ncbi:MAG TPA: pyridoxamine 5'-phosphate oxidase family protein [Pyrinomonadaceae bacterium]|jgi:general stress protein 26|nr:pyridoxamine 5'-phosphate oxidase family protein [Pyrinomonadaceae bacterium]